MLALDIGNSAAKGGLFDGATLTRTFRLAGPDGLPQHLGADEVERVGVASVVPPVRERVAAVLDAAGLPAPLWISARLRLPFQMRYRTPETLGADRIAAAAGAWVRFEGERDGRPLVVLDAGTAVTTEVVDAAGVYRGGAIGPGPDLLRRALARGTAQLPEVAPELPPSPIGCSTAEAVQVGVMLIFLDGVRGLLDRTVRALGAEPLLVVTGGWGAWLAERIEREARVEPDLVLYGVRALLDLNG